MKRIFASLLLIGVIIGFAGFSHSGITYRVFDYPDHIDTMPRGIDGDRIVGSHSMEVFGFFYDGANFISFQWPDTFVEGTWANGISGNRIVGSTQGQDYLGGFIYEAAAFTPLNFPGGSWTSPNGIEGNKIVGTYLTSTEDSDTYHGFLYDGAAFTTLDVPGSSYTSAEGISGARIVGTYVDVDNVYHGFLYDGVTFTTLDFPGAAYTFAYGISGTRIVGTYADADNIYHGFLYDGAAFTTLDFPGAFFTYAYGISGDKIVGYSVISEDVDGGQYPVIHGFIATIVNDNVTLTVTKSGTGAGTVTSSPTGINCGASCSGSFSRGASITLTAAAATGSTFTGWTGGVCSGTGTCTVTPTVNTAITAGFAAAIYTVGASVSGGHGSVSPATQAVSYGASASITLSPDTGYHIAGLIDNGQSVTNVSSFRTKNGHVAAPAQTAPGKAAMVANPYVIGNVTEDHNIVVTYAIDTYPINASVSGGHGSVAPATQTINRGVNASIAITPESGYNIAGITDNGQAVTVANPYTISNVTAAHTVVVTFSTDTYPINASVSGGHGSVAPATQTINRGANASIAITPESGYKIVGITDNGVAVIVANPYTISNVTAAHTVVVTFSTDTYPINASVSGGHGSVVPATQTINRGANASITITPESGYNIAGITDNGVAVTVTNPYTISNVTAAHTVVVTFSADTYPINASVSGGHGSVAPATQSVNRGANASIAITPESGYNIAGITDNGQAVTVTNPYTISNVTAAHTVVVTFSVTATLSVEKTGTGSGTVISNPRGINCGSICAYSFNDGKKVTLVARPDGSSLFAGWSGGGCSGTKATCSVTMNEYTYVTAVFKSESHIIVTPSVKNYGTVKVKRRKAASFIIKSTGKKPLAVGEISLSGDPSFVVTRNTCPGKNLPLNHACQVTVTFIPVTTLPVTTDLIVPSNDLDMPTVIVNLAGNGGAGAGAADAGEETGDSEEPSVPVD
ncbi:MAG TPA: hypothetical protein VGJ94_07110 [Syntrophorhabdaceae bacterium]